MRLLCLLLLLLLVGSSAAYTGSPSTTTSVSARRQRRLLKPPFPNGKCGGTVLSIPPSDTFAVDTHLNGNTFVLPPRPVHVWLPPDYCRASHRRQRYATLYCHDGQNVVSDQMSWSGHSWRLTGALTTIRQAGLLRIPTIVVMIPSSAEHLVPGLVRRRHLEYADSGVFADAHAKLVAETIKPWIDHHFDTNPHECYTMGTSMGGQASLQLLLRYPTLFAGAACLSPYFHPNTIARAVQSVDVLSTKRLYMDIGGDMGNTKVPLVDLMDHLTAAGEPKLSNTGYFWLDTQLQPGVHAMRHALRQAGLDDDDNEGLLAFYQEPGGRHNERAWAQRIDRPLLHLLGTANVH